MKLTLDYWHELCEEVGSRAQSIRYESSREVAGEAASASRGPNAVAIRRPGQKTNDRAGAGAFVSG